MGLQVPASDSTLYLSSSSQILPRSETYYAPGSSGSEGTYEDVHTTYEKGVEVISDAGLQLQRAFAGGEHPIIIDKISTAVSRG